MEIFEELKENLDGEYWRVSKKTDRAERLSKRSPPSRIPHHHMEANNKITLFNINIDDQENINDDDLEKDFQEFEPWGVYESSDEIDEFEEDENPFSTNDNQDIEMEDDLKMINNDQTSNQIQIENNNQESSSENSNNNQQNVILDLLPLDDGNCDFDRSELPDGFREVDIKKWGQAKLQAWISRHTNANQYYYRFNDPFEQRSEKKWTKDEEQKFFETYHLWVQNGWKVGSSW